MRALELTGCDVEILNSWLTTGKTMRHRGSGRTGSPHVGHSTLSDVCPGGTCPVSPQ